MRLAEIENLLSRTADFEVEILVDPSADDVLEDLTIQFTRDTPPSITPISCIFTRCGEPNHDGIAKATMRTSVTEFITNSIEFGEDPYMILQRVKDATDTATTAAAVEFMRTNEFETAQISPISAELQRTKLDL